MRHVPLRFHLPLLAMLCLAAAIVPARADDNIFAPAPAAKPFIDFDGRGFIINGQRTFLASGSLHYPRVPRALWRDRLLRMKRGGFNTVETYAFWNFHETQEGKFDFSGDKDLDAFLKLAKELGMYAVVRVGPYVCAEWDSGGYPVWLRFKPGVKVRQDNPEFVGYVDKWLEHVMPIVAANQIHRGGNVILVQLENEHPQGWGRDMPNNYFRHLRDKALALGLEVPWFFSGLHHGSDPAPGKEVDSKRRTSPWYTTEFWPGWYSNYGPLNAGDFRKFDRGTWKIIAYGGNGYNYYMLHGGTNFDTWNNDEDASSYDYGGAIGQAGDLRPIYYRFKRAALFARSFQSVLEDSENASADFQDAKDATTGAGLRLTARRSPAGTILFLDNDGKAPVPTHIKDDGDTAYPTAGPLTVAPGEIMALVKNYQLAPGVKIELSAARILGIAEQGGTTTLVVYGQPGTPAEVRFAVPGGAAIKTGALTMDGARLSLKTTIPQAGPDEFSFTAGGRLIRVLAVSDALADHTWFVEAGGKNYVVCGPDYVGEANAKGEQLQIIAEQSKMAAGAQTFTLYTADGARSLGMTGSGMALVFDAPTLTNWQTRRGDTEAQPGYNAAAWKATDAPLPMGADGDISAYAWYRTTLKAPAAGTYNLNFSDAGDWVAPFVNGTRVAGSQVKRRRDKPVARSFKVDLKAGDNQLAVLTAHYGRDKLFGYMGTLDKMDAKGIAGPVTLTQGAAAATGGVAITKWRYKLDNRGEAAASEMAAPDLKTDDWKEAGREDVFNKSKGFAWFRATLPALPAGAKGKPQMHFENVDDNATFYLNGKKLMRHEGWGEPFDVPLGDAWREGGPNVLAVLVENQEGEGGINGPAELQAAPAGAGDANAVTGWKMRGGLGDVTGGDWQPLPAGTPGVPTFYRAEFTAAPPGATGPHPIWRVTTTGLSRGFVWLNGHNLGRYPEKVPVNGIYLPECWIAPGQNTLVIYDEEGNAPAQSKIVVEAAASRTAVALETAN